MIGPRSLTLRLTLYFALASTVVLLGAGSLLGSRVQAHFIEQDLVEMRGKLELVRHMLARLQSSEELAAVPQQLADALIGHDHLALAVMAEPQRALYLTPGSVFPSSLRQWPPTPHLQPLEWEHQGRGFRGIVEVADTGIQGQGPVAVAVAVDIEHHRHFMAAFRTSLGLALFAGVALSALLGWLAARGGLRPVQQLAQAVRGISAGRLDERLPAAAMPSELVDLGQAFNQMLARLQDSFTRLSHFSSDIAHELRTPISNLMLQTQVAASKARSAEAYRDVLCSNLEEFERLARTIGDMLFLAKADNGLAVPSQMPMDLAVELRELFGFYEALAEEQGVGLVLDGSGAVTGDRLMIRRALGNLLANAIAHTPRDGTVRAALSMRADGGITLRISNPGTIDPEHLPRLFDRFYRVDPARQAGAGGAGLGLAITQSIVAAHGATIRAESGGGQVRLTIEWPLPERSAAVAPDRPWQAAR